MNRLDNLFNKNWFIKLSSLVIAFMLFLMVNMDNSVNQPGGLPGVTDGSRVLEEVEMQVYYDEDTYVLTEQPEPVQVTLRGPQNVLTVAQVTQGQQELYIDLEGKEAGVHYEQVQHRGFPSGLTITISPMTVRVTIQEKQTVSFPVDVELMNEGQLEEGYVVGTPSTSPSTVDVTAAQGMIDQIASARVNIDLTGMSQSFSDSFPVSFYDQSGNVLELNADPPAVEVEVPITSPNKEVPIRIGQDGELPDGVAIDSISTQPENITIFGPVGIINDISFIDLSSIDLTEISGDTDFQFEVPLPDGIERVEPEVITVEVEATQEAEREFSDFEIEVDGLEDNQSIEFLSPEQGQFDLVVKGSPDALQRLERDELEASLNVEGLSEGDHEEPLSINGPQNLRFQQNDMTVSFILSETNSSGSSTENNENEEDEVNGETETNETEDSDQDTS
ncbi:CdaR family protein [Salipaludibacillus daqingensis]|uniref:CdaR family protein n=1 Tax=Salipaludibacillus daqingensis TaxID=3041001 RepID=UPI00247327FF|nr:CdaR family protein [Salipaludibacillus daqingensis]